MSKAARGTKRACQSCGSKFYDLNRDPILCPICNTEYKLAKASTDSETPAPEVVAPVAPPKPAKPAPAEDDMELDTELASVDDEDLADLDDVDTPDTGDEDDDAFLPDEDEDEDDVAGFIGDTLPKGEDEI